MDIVLGSNLDLLEEHMSSWEATRELPYMLQVLANKQDLSSGELQALTNTAVLRKYTEW